MPVLLASSLRTQRRKIERHTASDHQCLEESRFLLATVHNFHVAHDCVVFEQMKLLVALGKRDGLHLTAKALDEAPVWDVADLAHEGQIQNWVPEDTSPESVWVLPKQVTCEESTMGSTNDNYMLLIHPACTV